MAHVTKMRIVAPGIRREPSVAPNHPYPNSGVCRKEKWLTGNGHAHGALDCCVGL